MYPSKKTYDISAQHFTDPGGAYAAVNLRVGNIDVDLTPEDAAIMGQQLVDAAASLKRLTPQ